MLISLLANSWRVFLFLLSITDVRSLDKIGRNGLYVLSGTGLAWKGCTSLESSKVFLVPGRVTSGLVASWTDEFHLGCGWILNWFRVVSAFGIAGVIAGVERNPWYLKLLTFFGDRSEEKHRHPAQHLVEDLVFISVLEISYFQVCHRNCVDLYRADPPFIAYWGPCLPGLAYNSFFCTIFYRECLK